MSWLSSIGKAIGKAASAVGSVAKKVVVPMASFAAGLVPGVGPLLGAGVDTLGNALLGGNNESAVEQAPTPAEMLAPAPSLALSLGSSPATKALASATSTEKKGFFGTLAEVTGIGDGKPGVFGIGDHQKGIIGIGTGKGKAKREAADAARSQAEDSARGEGLSSREIQLAGQVAAQKAENQVLRTYSAAKPDKNKDESSSDKSILYLVLAALGLAIL